MTWTQRLRLFGGIVAVLALTAALVLVFNQRQAQALSKTGQVVSASASVGAAYGGVVTKADAAEGDEVKKGQALFTVSSPDLQRDLSQNLKVASTDAFTVDTTASTVTYKALSDGRLSDVTAQTGGFVQNGANLATITSDGSQYALADFVLSPRDYERIVKGAPVSLRLPDDRNVEGTVQSVSVTTENGQAKTRVTVASDALKNPQIAELTHPGTPVAATLSLRDDGPLAGPTDGLRSFLIKIGLK
jgi:multidrug resistance efflux pump